MGLVLTLVTTPLPGTANFDPLAIIKRQIHKPNMLIVLDTSGSMASVPAGEFTGITEVGVDCDDGINCKGTARGRCKNSRLACDNDTNCAVSRCSYTGNDCDTSAECVATGKCSITGKWCKLATDCATGQGKCTVTGWETCNASDPCTGVGKCAKGTMATCYNPQKCVAGKCASGGANCSTDATCPVGNCTQGTCNTGGAFCKSNADCPKAAGKCANDVTRTCTANTDCVAVKRCRYKTGITCTSDAQCADTVGTCRSKPCSLSSCLCSSNSQCPDTKGTCSLDPGIQCTSSANCPSRAGVCYLDRGKTCWDHDICGEVGPCLKTANVCRGYIDNYCGGSQNDYCQTIYPVCNRPYTACTLYTANTCNVIANTCTIGTNTCNPGPANTCVTDTTDFCEYGGSGAYMCRKSQAVCKSSADCTEPGDSCGAATSRAVIAKRALATLIADNYNVINLGLMTFYQGGYHAYYPAGTLLEAVRLGTTTADGTLDIRGDTFRNDDSAGLTYQKYVGTTWSTFTPANNTNTINPIPVPDDPDITTLLRRTFSSTDSYIKIHNNGVPNGKYITYLWAMETGTAPSKFNVFTETAPGTYSQVDTIQGLAKGSWRKYGPYFSTISDGTGSIQFQRVTNDIEISGIEYWQVDKTYTNDASGVGKPNPGGKFFFNKPTLVTGGWWTPEGGPKGGYANGNYHATWIEYYQNDDYGLVPVGGNGNSRYVVESGVAKYHYDADWCGETCMVEGGLGTYEGSYYTHRIYDGPLWTQTSTSGTYPRADNLGYSYLNYYSGKTIQQTWQGVSAVPMMSFTPSENYYTRGNYPAWLDYVGKPGFPACSETAGTCGTQCGGRWDTQLAPFINPTQTTAAAKAAAVTQIAWMQKAHWGGLMFFGETPIGCTMDTWTGADRRYSAYEYMNAVKNGAGAVTGHAAVTADPLACRDDFVLLVTDGETNGPGDIDCRLPVCTSNPSTCNCKAVNAAYKLYNTLGVRTYVIGFGGDANTTAGTAANNNIARAGKTNRGCSDPITNPTSDPGCVDTFYAYQATTEDELVKAMNEVMYDAVKGSYSTSPATASAGSQQSNRIGAGAMALDSRVDFPSWNGHLMAYDVTQTPPKMAWDAEQVMKGGKWFDRRVYLADREGTLVQILVDETTMAVTNKAALALMGLGTSDVEAEKIAKWTLGDPAMGNPIVLGAFINASPIDVGSPGDNASMPGGTAFYNQHKDRIPLLYVGASDGMLHAFFTKGITAGGDTYPAGAEAFAIVPNDMIAKLVKVYKQGGQMPDPDKHVFGLAHSAKVKNICVKDCRCPGDPSTTICPVGTVAEWRTMLVMGEGPGGNNYFVLDITEPVSVAGGIADPPVEMKWDTNMAGGATYDEALGTTLSVPAFFYAQDSTKSDYGIMFASGYKLAGGEASQGQMMVSAKVVDGTVKFATQVPHTSNVPTNPTAKCNTSPRAQQDYAILADVATARNFAAGKESEILAAYVGDTWGQFWRWTPGKGLSLKTEVANQAGCDHPLVFAPAVVQLDRDNSALESNYVYLVQVTNSALDENTLTFPASKLIMAKDKMNSDGGDTSDTTFDGDGVKVLTVGVDAALSCAQTTGTSCTTTLATDTASLGGDVTKVRPTATPLIILKQDGYGFVIISNWYMPDLAGCSKGRTYLIVMDVNRTGVVTLKKAMTLANEPVSSPVLANDKIFVITSGGISDISTSMGVTITAGGAGSQLGNNGLTRFRAISWSEMP